MLLWFFLSLFTPSFRRSTASSGMFPQRFALKKISQRRKETMLRQLTGPRRNAICKGASFEMNSSREQLLFNFPFNHQNLNRLNHYDRYVTFKQKRRQTNRRLSGTFLVIRFSQEICPVIIFYTHILSFDSFHLSHSNY